jgi:secondary thiamine-phosphate synthase enzyme
MVIKSTQLKLLSEGHFNIIVITDEAREFVDSSGVRNGSLVIFFQHTTGAVYIGEHEAGIMADLQDMFERITPTDYPYKHHMREFDFNGHAHLRAALLPTSVSIPVVEGKMVLGTYQEIMILDDQVDQEPRHVLLQIMGEA